MEKVRLLVGHGTAQTLTPSTAENRLEEHYPTSWSVVWNVLVEVKEEKNTTTTTLIESFATRHVITEHLFRTINYSNCVLPYSSSGQSSFIILI